MGSRSSLAAMKVGAVALRAQWGALQRLWIGGGAEGAEQQLLWQQSHCPYLCRGPHCTNNARAWTLVAAGGSCFLRCISTSTTCKLVL